MRHRGVSIKEARGFGRGSLTVSGRIFAMLSSKGEFVVKLPRDRVAALVASGDGKPFEPGPGRVMKEWLAVSQRSKSEWADLAEEARRFVAKF